MKRPIVIVAVMLVIALVAAPMFAKGRAVGAPSADRMKVAANAAARLQTMYSQEELSKGVYIGSGFCIACHDSKESYTGTNHSSFIRRPLVQHSLKPGLGVIADYDKNNVDDFIQGLDFNTIASGFDRYKPNAPKLSVENGTYYITVGDVKMTLLLTVAGQKNGSAQRYVVKIPVTDTPTKLSTGAFFAPLQYTPGTGWAVYSGGNWYDAANKPKYSGALTASMVVQQPSNHVTGCIGCHATGMRGFSTTPQGETFFDGYTAVLYDTNDPTVLDYDGDGEMELMNIGCEACHGPGSQHILHGGDPSFIVNPKNLKAAQQAEICGRCHVTSTSLPNGKFNWPYNDATNTNWTPFDAKNGIPLANFYKMGGTKLPDGIHFNGGRPYNNYTVSSHATYANHTVGCPECHDPHEEGEGMLLREYLVEDGYRIKVSHEDNTFCLACHAKYGAFAQLTRGDIYEMNAKPETFAKVAKVVEAHTHHPYAPDRMMGLSRCIDCHMTSALGHSWSVVSPEETIALKDKDCVPASATCKGMPNGCQAGCHNTKVNLFGAGIEASSNALWNEAVDQANAKELAKYFGSEGIWWKTKKE